MTKKTKPNFAAHWNFVGISILLTSFLFAMMKFFLDGQEHDIIVESGEKKVAIGAYEFLALLGFLPYIAYLARRAISAWKKNKG